jgi:hypothetical protein
MKKLTVRAKWLYMTRQFDKLQDLTMRTKEGRDLFSGLCKTDPMLRAWHTAKIGNICEQAFNDPEKEDAGRQIFKTWGIPHLFDLYKAQHKKGFVTVDEAAKAIGVGAGAVREALRVEPDLFKIHGINLIK